jgi:hypothetical protein
MRQERTSAETLLSRVHEALKGAEPAAGAVPQLREAWTRSRTG